MQVGVLAKVIDGQQILGKTSQVATIMEINQSFQLQSRSLIYTVFQVSFHSKVTRGLVKYILSSFYEPHSSELLSSEHTKPQEFWNSHKKPRIKCHIELSTAILQHCLSK